MIKFFQQIEKHICPFRENSHKQIIQITAINIKCITVGSDDA